MAKPTVQFFSVAIIMLTSHWVTSSAIPWDNILIREVIVKCTYLYISKLVIYLEMINFFIYTLKREIEDSFAETNVLTNKKMFIGHSSDPYFRGAQIQTSMAP